MQTPLISNYVPHGALTVEPAPSCLRQLFNLYSGPAFQAPGAPQQCCMLMASSCLLPFLSLFISSFSICSSYQHFLLFPDLNPYPRVSAVSFMQKMHETFQQ